MFQITTTTAFRPDKYGVGETWGLLIEGATGDTILNVVTPDGPREMARFSEDGAYRDNWPREREYTVNVNAATEVWLI